jgi:DNA-binding transcriptional LysR family regulator
MELRHLRYFVIVAEERNFTRAAERLWIAQPGLSTQIRRFESELGVQLFERHTRGVNLTEAGEMLLERARAALAAADAVARTGNELDAGLAGRLRIGLAAEARWDRSSELFAQFAHDHHGVELSVLEGSGGALWSDLRDGRIDALVGPSSLASPDLRSLELGRQPWVVLVGTWHRLAGIGPVDGGDLLGERVLVGGSRDDAAYRREAAGALEAAGVAADPVSAGPWPALLAGVAAEETLVLTTGVAALPPGVTARPLRPRRPLAFKLLWRQELPSPTLRSFIALASSPASRGAIAPLAVAA